MHHQGRSSIEIVPVKSKTELRQFIRLPWQLYQSDPQWVAPLLLDEKRRFDPSRNPFYQHSEVQFFLARRAGQAVGRISAHIDRNHNEFHGEKTAFFGFFETIPDESVARALLEAAADWARPRGMKVLRGPFNFNTNGESGLLIDGFSTPCVMMAYNPPIYAQLIEANGFAKAKDLLAYLIRIDDEFLSKSKTLLERLRSLAERAKRRGFTVRNVNLRDFDAEVARLREIYNAAWERNWGFIPMTEAEFVAQAKELKQIVVPSLAKIVELQGEPVGFGLVLPDVYQILKPLRGKLLPFGIFKLLWGLRRIDGLRFITLGIKRAYRLRGVDALLYVGLVEETVALKKYHYCELSWLLEDNHAIINACNSVGGQCYKIYRIYEKSL
jgi:GNAT superfamily N-acetyltransferase